jgi:hypothetical protein
MLHVNQDTIHDVCEPIKHTLEAGRYTVVAQTHLSTPSNVRMTVLCKTATDPSPPHPGGNHAAPDANAGSNETPADKKGKEETGIEILVAGGILAAIIGGLCVLCVMKRATGSTFARKRQGDLDAHLDSGLDDDFGYGSAQAGAGASGFSTQSIQSISTGRHTFAE